jgi:hypothetical protein
MRAKFLLEFAEVFAPFCALVVARRAVGFVARWGVFVILLLKGVSSLR